MHVVGLKVRLVKLMELILKVRLLSVVVENQERLERFFIKFREPFDKAAGRERSRLILVIKDVRRSATSGSWVNILNLVRVEMSFVLVLFVFRLLLLVGGDLRGGALGHLTVLVCTFNAGGNEFLLGPSHEGAKEKSGHGDKTHGGADSEFVVLDRVASDCGFFVANRNLEHKREGDGTSNHATVGDEEQLTEGDGLLLETEAEGVERKDDAADTTNHNHNELQHRE